MTLLVGKVNSFKCSITYYDLDGSAQTFTVWFKGMLNDEIAALWGTSKTDKALAKEVLLGWDNLPWNDDDGTPFTFNETNIDKLLNRFSMDSLIAKSFIRTVLDAREKNLSGSPATSPAAAIPKQQLN